MDDKLNDAVLVVLVKEEYGDTLGRCLNESLPVWKTREHNDFKNVVDIVNLICKNKLNPSS